MTSRPPFDSPVAVYQQQAAALLDAVHAGRPEAMRIARCHPRFRDEKIPWLEKKLTDDDIRRSGLTLDDARLIAARACHFRDWPALAAFAAQASDPATPVHRFEAAVEAVVNGDLATLQRALRYHPELVHARSTRITEFDPPIHRATLLHYTAANGVEGYRQKTPPNAVDIAKALLEAGADPNSLAALYGGECTTLSLLVSSCHPAQAGLQVALAEILIDYGASVEEAGSGNWTSPLYTALVFGYRDAAEALVRRGARVDTLPAAAGLGRLDDVQRFLPATDPETRHRALAFAVLLGHTAVARFLIEEGEDPTRHNPPAMHAHGTPLHHAAGAGNLEMVQLLVEKGARLDVRDTIWNATPLDWAVHEGKAEVADYLRTR